jgi:hypothetical protein
MNQRITVYSLKTPLMRLLITLLLLVVIAAVLFYFLPGSIHIEKSMVLKAKPEVVFRYLNEGSRWKDWAEWLKADPSNNITYNGPGSGPGARINWNSQVAAFGSGTVQIESAQSPNQLTASIQFNIYGRDASTFLLENTGNGTRVTWINDISLTEKNRFNKVYGYTWKKRLDAWLDASIKTLDEITAIAPDYITPGKDSVTSRLDSLARQVDSLKAHRDTTVLVQ